MASQNHTHKYRRAIGRITEANKDSKFIGYYRCVLSNCTHREKTELILGKESICNRCGNKFTLPNTIRKMVNWPHCKNCTKKKPSKEDEMDELEEFDQIIESI